MVAVNFTFSPAIIALAPPSPSTAGAERIGIDGNGRILIPKRYLESADIQGEVRFIGMDDSIEIWNRQKADNLLNNPENIADSLECLMNPNNDES